jgi:hypothetical protein
MFRINDNKGFSITFPNGYTVSVQFGPGNYSSNYNLSMLDNMGKPMTANTAETALIAPDGSFVAYKDDDVQGYQSVTDVLELLQYASQLNST